MHNLGDTPPNKAGTQQRKTTVAIVEKATGKVLRYDNLEGAESPFERASRYFDAFVKEVVSQIPSGEERTFLFYSRTPGLRPDVEEVKITNRPMPGERSVMGYSGPGAVEIAPYQEVSCGRSLVKKGEFPRPPGADPSVLIDDDGIDEESIVAAAREVLALLKTALAEKFSEPSHQALLSGLQELLHSTGATENEPREDWDAEGSIDGDAMVFYDCAVSLWLESGAADALPNDMAKGCLGRMREDAEHAMHVRRLAEEIRHGRH